ncbi:SMI1/KNR4 family protein [Paenibacillus sp. YIM B09110]|uniref:SMI1/KNR4 family protein n=1 Tax=Paenibacillus sp. YIM B09110 TaxID=3126102 RepID=UPI00301E1A41
MSNVIRLIQDAKTLKNCEVNPTSGLPILRPSHVLPPDLKEFYEVCGGKLLFNDSDFSYRVLPPMEFKSANLEILGEEVEDDITNDWYTVVDCGNGDFITIDLHPERLGRCYDSFHETHGLVGDTPIIALSFTELLQQLLQHKGKLIYWLDENFKALGDAYDKR